MRDFKGYTGVNTTKKIIDDAKYMVDKSLNDPYASTECLISPNGDISKKFLTNIQVFQRYDSDGNSIKVIGKVCDIERGNYIMFKDQTWLVTSKPEDNGVFRKAIAELCRTNYYLKENDKEIIVGLDKWNRPIFETQEGNVIELPIVPRILNTTSTIVEVNDSINLLDGNILVTMPYRESEKLVHNEYFTMYNEKYRIIRIDPSESINGVGLLRIVGDRVGRDTLV